MKEFSPAAELVFETLDGLDPAQLAVIEPWLVPWVRQQYRLRCRDRVIIALSACYIGRLCTGNAISAELARDLARFRARSKPETGKRALLAAALRLNRGKSLGKESIRAVLGGKNRR